MGFELGRLIFFCIEKNKTIKHIKKYIDLDFLNFDYIVLNKKQTSLIGFEPGRKFLKKKSDKFFFLKNVKKSKE